jgi:stage V sporulation protein D (sporulation-specific penicillin-binding protein)
MLKNCIHQPLLEGTGRKAYIDGYRVGGKTGTVQKVGPKGQYMQGNYILSFLGLRL